jgi:hypothetical protein
MQKVTNAHYKNIIAITLATLQQYTNFILKCAQNDKTNNISVMHLQDIQYMQNALNAFIKNADAAQLQNSIMLQDTFVREYYFNTLQYIEQNNLVSNFYCS